MEIVEMFCDLLLARFGLLTQMKELDSGIAEQVSSLIWVAPRLQSDVEELRGNLCAPRNSPYTLFTVESFHIHQHQSLLICSPQNMVNRLLKLLERLLVIIWFR